MLRKNRKLSEKHKRRISKAKKGKPAWNKGKPMSKEQKVKLSKICKGKKFSEKHKRKISEANKGRKLSKEHIDKLRRSRKGHKCSIEAKKKMSESHKGEKSHFWKGGITSKNLKIRSSIEYRLWREAVFARDNFTCQKTGIVGGSLEAHHIKPFAQYPKLRFAIDNGITLSEKAHREFHKKYGKNNNTKKQLLNFVN